LEEEVSSLCFLEDRPSWNYPKPLSGRELEEEVSSLCFLEDRPSWNHPKPLNEGNKKVEVCMVALKTADSGLWCLADVREQEELRTLRESSSFCLDLFRFSAHNQTDPSKGVEAVMRRFEAIQQRNEDADPVKPSQPYLNQAAADQSSYQTQDILEHFKPSQPSLNQTAADQTAYQTLDILEDFN